LHISEIYNNQYFLESSVRLPHLYEQYINAHVTLLNQNIMYNCVIDEAYVI